MYNVRVHVHVHECTPMYIYRFTLLDCAVCVLQHAIYCRNTCINSVLEKTQCYIILSHLVQLPNMNEAIRLYTQCTCTMYMSMYITRACTHISVHLYIIVIIVHVQGIYMYTSNIQVQNRNQGHDLVNLGTFPLYSE